MKAAGSKSVVSSQGGEAKLATVCRLEGKEEKGFCTAMLCFFLCNRGHANAQDGPSFALSTGTRLVLAISGL